MSTGGEYKALPPNEAIAFFRQKLPLPSRAWTDLLRAEHDRAFVTAGAVKMSLLADLKAAVERAIEEGTTLSQFRSDFSEAVGRHGWPWRAGRTAGYEAWRTRLIYQTNLSTAYAAGRRAQQLEVVAERPYWLYRHGGSVTPREQHLAWDGLVLPAGDPWWDSHYPPNGWGCSCLVLSLSRADVEARGLKVADQAPRDEVYEWANPNTGEVEAIPRGVDPGWNYTPGERWRRAQTPALGDLGSPGDPRSPAEPPTPAGVVLGPEPSAPPRARKAERSRLLPPGLSEGDYERRFLAQFEGEVFVDAAGEALLINEQLFRVRRAGQEIGAKTTKKDRQRYLLLLADTLKSPDEIWVRIEPLRGASGKYRVVRRYLATWDVDGQAAPAVTSFEWSQTHWAGLTAFPADTQAYWKRQRAGVRLFRRSDRL